MRRALWQMAGAVLLTLLCGVGLAGQTPAVDPYSLAVVQAACGAEGGSPPQAMPGGHVADSALKPGMARVYVITETRTLFGARGEPVRLGMDGSWFGANRSYVYGFSYVDVSPGVHHLCVASTVKGVLPHTSAAVVLARVDAVAGQSYYFYNQCTQLARFFTLQTMSAEDGAMYIQALPSSTIPKLWETAAVQATCGADADTMPSGPVPTPILPGPPAPGHALVYFFSGVPQFGSHKFLALLLPGPQYGGFVAPTHIGIDGNWVGETRARSYMGVQMAPGVHRLCSATKWILGMKPTLHLGQLDVVAGKTYFVDTNTLRSVDNGLATVWLRRIAAMPKSDTPDLKVLKQWSRTNFPASQDELRACGIPAADSAATAPTVTPPVDEKSTASQAFFLLKSNVKLRRQEAINVGLDGRWVASLRRTSWVSLPLFAGRHDVCIHTEPRGKRGVLRINPASSLFLSHLNEVDGASIYFRSVYQADDAGNLFWSSLLDPDEGALLVTYYPRADTLHP